MALALEMKTRWGKLPTLNHPPPHSDLSCVEHKLTPLRGVLKRGEMRWGRGQSDGWGVSRFAAKSLKRLMYLKDLCCHNVLVHKSPKHFILSVQSFAFCCCRFLGGSGRKDYLTTLEPLLHTYNMFLWKQSYWKSLITVKRWPALHKSMQTIYNTI